jgi:hypothetical protein
MACAAAQSSSTWVEDRATQRCDPSADPGAETEGRAALLPPTFTRLRDQHQGAKPSRHEAAKFPTGRSSQVANVNRHKFHFPLNQHNGRLGGTNPCGPGLSSSVPSGMPCGHEVPENLLPQSSLRISVSVDRHGCIAEPLSERFSIPGPEISATAFC